jgi:hypothetical protein
MPSPSTAFHVHSEYGPRLLTTTFFTGSPSSSLISAVLNIAHSAAPVFRMMGSSATVISGTLGAGDGADVLVGPATVGP